MQNNGIGFFSLLGLLFIGLKLGGVITWSWIWVLAPFWIGAVTVIAVIGIVVLFAAMVALANR